MRNYYATTNFGDLFLYRLSRIYCFDCCATDKTVNEISSILLPAISKAENL